MAPMMIQGGDTPPIFDIRQNECSVDLAEDICKGLMAPSPSLPLLLLWDDRGQILFDELSQTPSYYPFHAEIEALTRYGSDISRSVPQGGVLLELGCGAIRKTKSILFNFHQQQKRIHYIALDVSPQGLSASLTQLHGLFKDSPYITITGLLGTYDDCIAWLAGVDDADELGPVTIMWLGNSIANLDSEEQASSFLARFRYACDRSGVQCQFIVSMDICQRRDKVLDAYSPEKPKMRDFLLNPVRAANLVLGYDALSSEDWTPVGSLDEHGVVFHLAATRNVRVELPPATTGGGRAELVAVAKGERIRLVSSGKWAEASIKHMCERAGFRIQQRWKDNSGDYCIFLFGPTLQ